ncbi:MAG: tRNA glutamyl-Q(34) synthetase GluQRS [Alphaproteobacteria bacterium]|jgi:glutamyl-Q tRNA(Asp) synthetase|nr:tRNA glutamyl-Q(34) synthetase GluQRS [Alphaproteobacteria bacterium]
MSPISFKTRFAPSPTGFLHIGHAASVWTVWEDAGQSPENFLLRIEDIDQTRCKPEFEQSIYEDLAWLGLSWKPPILRQSEHFKDYKNTLDTLHQKGLIYPCFCTRKEIELEILYSATAPHGTEGLIYPGTCRHLSHSQQTEKMNASIPYALRLDTHKAWSHLSTHQLYWHDRIKGKQETTEKLLLSSLGDPVLARKDTPASYHLCVTHDDNLQDISLITRGKDLFFSTHLHRLLQELLSYNVPEYHHHPLLTDNHGKQFSKRNHSLTLRDLRNKGLEVKTLRNMILHGNIKELLV